MIALEDALPLRNVALYIDADTVGLALEKALQLLENDGRMLDWPAFVAAVMDREKQSSTHIGGALLLPHGRGEFVRELSMSLVRLQTPVGTETGEVRFIIAVAVPASMTADYLRLVGALARVFRDEKTAARLSSFKTAKELVDWLGERCR